MNTNYITRLLANANKSDLWRTYGFIIAYVGSGKFSSVVSEKKLYGLYNTDFTISNGANLISASEADLFNSSMKKSGDALIDHLSSKNNFIGMFADKIKGYMHQTLGRTIAESIKIYDSGNGRPRIHISTFFIPGLFNFKSYDILEQWAAYATLPLNVSGEKTGFSQYIYSRTKNKPGGFIDLSSDLFSIKLNNLIHIPGGMYIIDFTRTYSNDRDEDGKPIFCRVDMTLEYYREMFADEFVKLFSEF